MKLADKLDVILKPHNWDKAVSVAYLRLLGLSQKKAAKGAGIGERTLARYELSEWWPEACREAVDRWMQQLAIECRTTIMAAVKSGDVATAVKMLERIDKRLAPPRQQLGVQHSGDLRRSVRDLSDEELFTRATQLANRLGLVPPASNGGGPSV